MASYQYDIIDGQYVEKNIARQYRLMNSAFYARFGLSLRISSGTRIGNMQEVIFRQRYVLAGDVRGRRVYDTRWWNGRLWYRISSAGTVAVPGTSNHEENGPNGPRSIDIADTGNDPGVTTRGTERDLWMQQWASSFGFENEGYKFAEAWHKTGTWIKIGVYDAPAPTPAPKPKDNEDEMAVISAPGGNIYTISPGQITHNLNMNEVNLTKNVSSESDELHPIKTVKDLSDLLHGYGIPASVLDGNGMVLDVAASWRNGRRTHTPGATWSRGIEAVELDRQLLARAGGKEFV